VPETVRDPPEGSSSPEGEVMMMTSCSSREKGCLSGCLEK